MLVREHAWERFDRPTAGWCVAKRAARYAAPPQSIEACLTHWRHDHAGLHTYEALRFELDQRFTERFFAWTPYLHGELGADTEREEQALIDRGVIRRPASSTSANARLSRHQAVGSTVRPATLAEQHEHRV